MKYSHWKMIHLNIIIRHFKGWNQYAAFWTCYYIHACYNVFMSNLKSILLCLFKNIAFKNSLCQMTLLLAINRLEVYYTICPWPWPIYLQCIDYPWSGRVIRAPTVCVEGTTVLEDNGLQYRGTYLLLGCHRTRHIERWVMIW